MEQNNNINGNLTSVTDQTNSSDKHPRHDTFIRKAFENPRVAYEFFDMHLPREIKAMFSSHTLKMEKESFIAADLKQSISDILFSAKFNDETGYLWILLEHVRHEVAQLKSVEIQLGCI